MNEQKFVFRKVPSNNKKVVIGFVSLGITLLLFLYFPFVPNLDYLKQVMPIVQKELGQIIPIILIILFYSIFVFGFYKALLPFFSKRVYLAIVEEDFVEIIVGLKEQHYMAHKSIFNFEKNKIIVNLNDKDRVSNFNEEGSASYEPLYLKNYDYKEDIYNNFKSNFEISLKSVENNTTENGFTIINPKLTFAIFTLGFFIIIPYAINIIEPYKREIGLLFNSNGALLVILTALPFLMVYALTIYLIVYFLFNVKISFESNQYITFRGRLFNYKINKERIKQIIIGVNEKKNQLERIFIKTKITTYSLNFYKINLYYDLNNFLNLDKHQPIIKNGRKIYKL